MPSTFVISILAGVAIATVLYFMFGSDPQQPQHAYSDKRREELNPPESTYGHRLHKRTPKYNETCIICIGEFLRDDYSTLRCLHTFHKECIEQWKESSDLPALCPICRAKV